MVKKHTQNISVRIFNQISGTSYSRTYYLVSACLAGVKCRYDGSVLSVKSIIKVLQRKSLLLVCPEKLGDLRIPRLPAEVVSNNPGAQAKCDGKDVWMGRARVLSRNGRDLTFFFKRGVHQVKGLIQLLNIKVAYLKSKSPSCGCGRVYNRYPQAKKTVLVKGDGVLTVLLKKFGIRIISVD